MDDLLNLLDDGGGDLLGGHIPTDTGVVQIAASQDPSFTDQGVPVPTVELILEELRNTNARLTSLEAFVRDVFGDDAARLRARRIAQVSQKMNYSCIACRTDHVSCSHDLPCKRCTERGVRCKYTSRRTKKNRAVSNGVAAAAGVAARSSPDRRSGARPATPPRDGAVKKRG